MTERKLYGAQFGPYLYNDTDLIEDPDGDFSSFVAHAAVSDGGYLCAFVDFLDTNISNHLTLFWNEDDDTNRTLALLVAGGNRSLTLNENFTIADGFDVTIQALGQANQFTMNENFIIGDGYDVTIQALGQANQFTMNESFIIGDGFTGTLTYSADSKTLTVENDSLVSQDYTEDASPTFANVKLTDLGDGKIPYHIDDATGLADSILSIVGNVLVIDGTVACSDLTDSYIPYHVSDILGLADSGLFWSGTALGISMVPIATLDVAGPAGFTDWIGGNGAGGTAFSIYGSYNDAGTKAITIKDGKVGIDEASPDEMLHLTSSTSAKPIIKLENTNADADAARLYFRKTSDSPADNDSLGFIAFYGNDSIASETYFGYMSGRSSDVTNGTEAGELYFTVKMNGTDRQLLTLNGYNGVADQGKIVFNEDGQDIDFRVEAVGVTNALFVQGSDGYVSLEAGFLYIGKNDTQKGTLFLLGHTAGEVQGGAVALYTSADYDATIEYFLIQPNEDDLYIGPNNNPDSLINVGSSGLWQFTAGSVAIGVEDSVIGNITLYGGAAASTYGAGIFLQTSADHDTTINRYRIQVYEDDLYIGPETDQDSLIYNGGNGYWNFTNTSVRVGIANSSPLATLDVIGTSRFGNSTTNYFNVEADGDVVFVGGSGLVYGFAYGSEIAWTQASAAQNTWYNIVDADIADGQLHNVTHDGNGLLTVGYTGKYFVSANVSIECSQAGKHIQVGIEVNGSGSYEGTITNHLVTGSAAVEYALSLSGIIALSAGDTVEITIRTTDAGTPNLTVDHFNLSIIQVGG